VKAGADALDAASIAAPTTAAIVLRDRMRKSMVLLQVAETASANHALTV